MAFQINKKQNVTPVAPYKDDTNPAHAAGKEPPVPTKDVSADAQRSTSWGRSAYGTNAYNGGVSTRPGETITSDLASRLRDGQDDGEHTLDLVQKNGAHFDGANMGDPDAGSWETRKIAGPPQPDAFGMKNRNANPVTIGDNKRPSYVQTNPVRKPS
jgi:hypothetical protein